MDQTLMSEGRQTNQLELAIPEENVGEAFQDFGEGALAFTATKPPDPVKGVNQLEANRAQLAGVQRDGIAA
ncbi:MAG: hypothetical protein R3C01_02690 [Planctomycetaceae bacterium]